MRLRCTTTTAPSSGCFLTVNPVGAHYGHDSDDLDGEADMLGQEAGRSPSFMSTVADIRHPGPIDEERVATDPDARLWMVLGIHGEHPTGPDHDMVDVRSTIPHSDGVQAAPVRTQPCQLLGNGLLGIRPDPPRTLVGLDPEQTGQHMADPTLSLPLSDGPLRAAAPALTPLRSVQAGSEGSGASATTTSGGTARTVGITTTSGSGCACSTTVVVTSGATPPADASASTGAGSDCAAR